MEIEKVAQWIETNKYGKAFRDLDGITLRNVLREADDVGFLFYTFDKAGNLTGVLVGKPIIHISHVLTKQKGEMKRLLKQLLFLWPYNYAQAVRKDKIKVYHRNMIFKHVFGA